MLEAGPVRTPIVSKAEEWCQVEVDESSTDPKTRSLLELMKMNMKNDFEKYIQDCEEVAQFVKDIALGEKCDLRYQTNEEFGSKEVAAKFFDPTGNKSVDLVAKRYFCEHDKE